MIHIKKQTKEEKIEMYNKLSKEELINMLIASNEMLNILYENVNLSKSSMVQCDSCKNHPNVIYYTSKGCFCENCKSL